VLTGVDCSPYVLEGRTPEAVVFPGSKDEVAAVLGVAADAGIPVIPWGGGTRLGLGSPPPRLGLVIGLTRLNRVIEHVPGDLTATVEAGITLGGLQAALGARGQWVSLDPPHAERATLGGILASNASGPRRHLYGTCRDLLIGLTVVGADGSIVRGGGKVVKNVAGYDLPKLFVGSHGTLGVIVETTFKLRPVPDEEQLVAIGFDRLKDCGAAARALLASDLIPSAIEMVDAVCAPTLGLAAGAPALVVGFDGIAEQVQWQLSELAGLVRPLGGRPPVSLPPATWTRLATVARDAVESPAAVMRFSVLPTQVAETMEQGAHAARQRGLSSAWAAHAGVGVVTGTLLAGGETAAVSAVLGDWRAIARAGSGHANLTRAPLAVKAQMPVWDDPDAAGRIMQRIKAQLDPNNVLNPGRFVTGI